MTATSDQQAQQQRGAFLQTFEGLLARGLRRALVRVADPAGGIDPLMLEREQRATHALAWFATYAAALRELDKHVETLQASDRAGAIDLLIRDVAFAEYAAQIVGGLPMSQNEIARLSDLDFKEDDLAELRGFAREFERVGGSAEQRRNLFERMLDAEETGNYGDPGDDDMLAEIRREMHRFASAEIAPYAHGWHQANAYIPLEVVDQMGQLGVFGLTIPEDFGGLGLGKLAMCAVSEELSRAWIGAGSLGTRSEIAAELILGGGTDEQKSRFLPRIASGACLPTAVFTEPNTGSDLASLTTRAVRDGDIWRISGAKTWITHAARADLMTILARTDPNQSGWRGLSMFLAEKPRGTDEEPFPSEGLSGSEIAVLGYRGMREYELAFDGFPVSARNLLGEVEGQGFKQLMRTFESARIQTASRAIGVARSALDLGMRYARERRQFGKPIAAFPRVSDKLVMMAVEIALARALTAFAAREKDAGRRCDMEAGMAKLLAARVAWAAADSAVQIHGGNGFALEYPVSRVLCDARILSIFEGAAEIQAQVIARRLLEQEA